MAARVGFGDEDRDGSIEYGLRVSDMELKLRRERTNAAPKISLLTSDWISAFIRIKDGDTGEAVPLVFTERKYLRRVYDTPARKILLFTSRQTEKCLNINSSVSLANGDLVEAKDVAVGTALASMQPGGRLGTNRVTWVSKRLRKECVEIETRQGHVVRVALTHPMRTWESWTAAGDLRVGDRLAAVRQCGAFTGTSTPPAERIRLTAYLIGDGSLSKSQGQVGFTQVPGPVLEEFLRDVVALGGSCAFPGTKGKAVQVRVHKLEELNAWLVEDGLRGKKSAEKTVPSWVFNLSRADTALFLNRLWSTDGHVSQRTASNYNIVYASMSKLLVEQVQALLWKFGIPSRIRTNWPSIYKKRGEKRLAYLLNIETKEGIRRFLTEVGALGKSETVALPERDSNNNQDTFPKEIQTLLSEIFQPHAHLRGRAGSLGLLEAGLHSSVKYPPTYEKLEQYLRLFRADTRFDQKLVGALEQHLHSDLYWDRVKSVTPLGVLECVDFEVENTHNFVASGLITHNSTTVGNRIFARCGMRPGHTVLFVSPSAMQTSVFSKTRMNEIIDISPLIKAQTHAHLTNNLFEKHFANGSKVYLRYAFLTADRIRGLSVNDVFADEIQDLLPDTMPVIEETASHHQETLFVYSGTPKSLDNTIQTYWNDSSTASEWVIPCEHHGLPKHPATWHWNILGEKNLGREGPICDRCGAALNPEHPYARWVEMQPFDGERISFEGYRVSRLMVPWFYKSPKKWKEILAARERYSTAKFFNEVLALSYDSASKPISKLEVIAACDSKFANTIEAARKISANHTVFFGIDWGCHDDQTRILTERGFQFFKDLTDDDRVAQWDPETRQMSFVKPKARTVRNWDRPLLHFKTRGGLDLMVTDTHRMRACSSKYKKWVTETAGETVQRRSDSKFVGYVDWAGEEVGEFVLPGLPVSPGYGGSLERRLPMDKWLELMGYLVTEGGLCRNDARFSCVKMSQRVPVNSVTAAKIKSCLDELGVSYSEFPNPKTGDINWTIYGKQYWQWYAESFGTSSSTKRLPRWVFSLSKRQLKILFDAMVAGDGSLDLRANCTGGSYHSTSKGLCEDFQEICLRLGLRCHVSMEAPAEGNRKTRWVAGFSAGRDYHLHAPHEVESVPYSGKVYCCAVDSGYIVTERNGKVSYQGNSGERAFTVLTVGAYCRDDASFQIFFMLRFTGPLTDPIAQMDEIENLITILRPKYVGTDFGFGFYQNKRLLSKYGNHRIFPFEYAPRLNVKLKYIPAMHRSIAFRTPLMSDLFVALKRGKVRLPKWTDIERPYGEDILNIHAEDSANLRMIRYDKPSGKTDDTFHATLYCLLASMLEHKRPDIIAPFKEEEQAQLAGYTSDDEYMHDIPQSYGYGDIG